MLPAVIAVAFNRYDTYIYHSVCEFLCNSGIQDVVSEMMWSTRTLKLGTMRELIRKIIK